VLKRVDIHLLYLSVWFFPCAVALSLILRSMCPIVACAGAMQFPLITRAVSKRRDPQWRLYVAATNPASIYLTTEGYRI
jgi:hypothetical protein